MSEHNKIIVNLVGAMARFAVRARQIPGGAEFYHYASAELMSVIWRLTENFTPEALTAMLADLEKVSTLKEVMDVVERHMRDTDGN
jgi:hypothetical protein